MTTIDIPKCICSSKVIVFILSFLKQQPRKNAATPEKNGNHKGLHKQEKCQYTLETESFPNFTIQLYVNLRYGWLFLSL